MIIVVENIVSTIGISGIDNRIGDVYTMLRSYLRIRPANYGQILMQMKRKGMAYQWDGYTYFINKKCQFPTGFIGLVYNYLTELGIVITFQDQRKNMPIPKGMLACNYITTLGSLAVHQIEAIDKTLANHITNQLYFPRGIWDMATNSRKTATAGSLINNIQTPKAIMLIGEQGLLKQHYNYYKTVFTGKDEVGFITSSKQQLGSILTICMIRTLYNRLKKSTTLQRDLNNRFNILITDEAHDLIGKQATYVINHINAGVRVAMSGTPLSGTDKVAKFRLIGMFGTVLH